LTAPTGGGAERLGTVHPLGGCALARTPAEGVVDHRGEVFGHPGLFVADGWHHPPSPRVPPSLTRAALADDPSPPRSPSRRWPSARPSCCTEPVPGPMLDRSGADF